jgi:hypothetical protein
MNDLFCVYSSVQKISPVINNTKTYVTADSVLQFAVFANVVHTDSIDILLLAKPLKPGIVRLGSVSL